MKNNTSLLAAAALGVGGLLLYKALQRPTYSFRGKTVFLTGGSRGLGLLLARRLADAGAKLCIVARSDQELDRAHDELTSRGVPVLSLTCDITDRQQVGDAVARARQRLGPIDVLINNAGVIGVGPVEEMRLEDFELAMKTHYWACLYTMLEVIPEMKARRQGRIVNISSIGGKVPIPHLAPYVASKFALAGLSGSFREELAEHGITVTTIFPGLMRTGSHIQAEFKGQHKKEYAWFALGGTMPGPSMNADRAARQILSACANGDAELVLSLPAKLLVTLYSLAPNSTLKLAEWINRFILPDPGGVGPQRMKGYESRGLVPSVLTAFGDWASEENNETTTAPRAATQ